MTALHRAVTVSKDDHVALGVGEDLKLDVPRFFQVALHVNSVVSERRLGFAACQLPRVQQCGLGMNDSHAFTTPPGSSLDDDRVANPSGDADDGVGIVRQGSIGTGYTGYPGLAHHFDRRDFIPHQADSFGCRPDKNKAAFFYVLCKISIFSQKTITRMDSTGIGHFSRCDHGRDVEVASRCRGRPDAN